MLPLRRLCVAAWQARCRHAWRGPGRLRALAARLPPSPRAAAAGDENPGRIAADIVFVLHEKPHPAFSRDGNDLIYTHR